MQKNKTLIEIMKEREFTLENVNAEEKTFIFIYKGQFNNSKDIICEVHTGNKFKFVYTNDEMTGFLDSGLFDNYKDEKLFNNVLSYFSDTVEVLKSYYGGCDE